LEGARKCRACKAWLTPRPAAPRADPRFPRAAIIVATAVASTLAVIVSSHPSPVGEAPPLTPLPADSASAGGPLPGAIGPEPDVEAPEPPRPSDPSRGWHVRDFKLGDPHPLDIAWSPSGKSLYVSADDATLREYKVETGEVVHQASMPAQGDHLRLLFDRYVAFLRHTDASRIPVMDTTAWDRDPLILSVGSPPGDVIELPDGKSIVAATMDGKRVSRFELPGGVRMGDITLPHATGQLFLVRAEDRPYVAAMGALAYAGRPAGAWIDLFDPNEMPFGATRRSISAGREPRKGAVTESGSAIFFPDRVSNTATLLGVAGTTDAKVTAVGQRPEAAFVLGGDRWGVTLNGGSRTASVVDLTTMKVRRTLMLDGEPRTGVASRDRRTLFVTLGGSEWPPQGSGVMVVAGDPPRVVASLPTGKGAIAVAVSKDGTRAAVASYYDKTVTIVEQ
jgi:DNA-binding beta-propeller fold protein YncE